MASHNLNVAQFARQAGLHPNSFRSWVNKKGQRASKRTLVALAGILGISEHRATEWVGGIVADDRRRQVTEQLVAGEYWRRAQTPEAKRKRSATMTGKTLSAGAREKLRARMLEPSRAAESSARLKAMHQTIDGKIMQTVGIFLRWHPTPTRADVEMYADRVAARLGTTRATVLRVWRKVHRIDDLWDGRKGGPRLMEPRHKIVEQYMAQRGVTPGGPRPRKFWNDAALYLESVTKNDKEPEHTDGPSLQAWYHSHRLRCRLNYCVAAVETKITPRSRGEP